MIWADVTPIKSGAYKVLVLALVLTGFGLQARAQQTLFTTQTPVQTGQNDGRPLELGMKFQSSINGQIDAIRYWKDAQESGSHVGHIWSSSGALLASVTFVGESASGWQQQALGSPLNIDANTTYVVTVNINSFYVVTTGPSCYPCSGSSSPALYFPITNGALTSIADDHNGVFGDSGSFPTQTFQYSNYFRDVVFSPGLSNPPQPAGCLSKLVSVDGGNTFAAFTDPNHPAKALSGMGVEFKLVVTNCGQTNVTPNTVDDCINANASAVPFACAPPNAGGLGAPGLILYEPPTAAPSSTPIVPGASVTYSKADLPNFLVTPNQLSNLCQTALQLTGQQLIRNDAEFDGSDANGAVAYEADAYVQCSTTQVITATCVVVNAVQGVPITPVTLTASGGTGPYTFVATGLPNGLTMSSGGTISGTPTVSGTFNYTVTITDSLGNTGSINCSLTVSPSQQGKTFSIGPASMEGSLTIQAGDWVSGGFSFTYPGSHPEVTETIISATVSVPVSCVKGGPPVATIVVPIGSCTFNGVCTAAPLSFDIPTNNNAWWPTGDANNVASWQGAAQAPNFCSGNPMYNSTGAVFVATVSKSPAISQLANFRFKYRDPNAKGKGNVNCTDQTDPRRSDAATCGASWSGTVKDP